MLMSLLEVCQEWGGQEGSYVDETEGSIRRLKRESSSTSLIMLIDSEEVTLKFFVEFFIRSVSGMRDEEGGYLEDIEGSKPEK